MRKSRQCLLLAIIASVLFAYSFGRLQAVFKKDAFAESVSSPESDVRWPASRFHVLGYFQKDKLDNHLFGDDGLLVVNPNGSHPIYELIKQANIQWGNKVRRASTTLEAAVREYKERYRRAPPWGFDLWWQYVQRHKVQLPDEYDQIYHDLEPFWGLDPVDLQTAQAELEQKRWSFTIGKEMGKPIDFIHKIFPESRWEELDTRAKEMVDLLKDVEHLLPPFRAVFSPWDNPSLFSDYQVKAAALEASAVRTHVGFHDLPEPRSGWTSACPPSSPARQKRISLDVPYPPRPNKTFIFDHRKAMDPCLHPNLFHHHGQFLSHDGGPKAPRLPAPQFSYCSTQLHYDIRPAVPLGWVEDMEPSVDPEWEDKVDERLLWRGSNTGIIHGPRNRWKAAHRARLVAWAQERAGTTKVLQPDKSKYEPVGEGQQIRKALINPAMIDVSFTGPVIAHPPDYAKTVEGMFEFRKVQSWAEAGKYKYVLDVDGNGWSSRFKRLLTSNSLVFKSTIYPEWYTDRIQPWVHFVPCHVDLSDLYDSLVFFRGDLNGEGGHDDHARRIASTGRQWSKTFWRKEDMTAYMFRLFLEYARVMSIDREAMSYQE